MDIAEFLDDAFARMPDLAAAAVEGLDADALSWRPDDDANPIGWLVWHLTRVQDDHVADVASQPQVWQQDPSLAERFGLEAGATDLGYGHTSAEVARVRPEGPEVLLAYLDEVVARTRAFVADLGPDDLDRVVDDSWDPPVTLGVRLGSVVNDDLQHLGQAAYVRGLLDRRDGAGSPVSGRTPVA